MSHIKQATAMQDKEATAMQDKGKSLPVADT
jgi:hypothetical protein